MLRNPVFVPKIPEGSETPWINFGCQNREEYERWLPEVCGICCLKMVGDTVGLTNNVTIYTLTKACIEKGGFVIDANGKIHGVFHKPLLDLAIMVGLQGQLSRHLTTDVIKRALNSNRYVMLSISLSKVNATLKESHLIVLYNYIKERDAFIAHDCARVLSPTGFAVSLSAKMVDHISNKRGIILWNQSFAPSAIADGAIAK